MTRLQLKIFVMVVVVLLGCAIALYSLITYGNSYLSRHGCPVGPATIMSIHPTDRVMVRVQYADNAVCVFGDPNGAAFSVGDTLK